MWSTGFTADLEQNSSILLVSVSLFENGEDKKQI
jgi:hypothetical protein